LSKEKFWDTFEILFTCRCRYGESHAYIKTTKALRLFKSQNCFRLTCSDIKSEHFEKPEKSFPILSCFRWVVYSLQRYRRIAVYKRMQKKSHRKENRKSLFPSFRWIQYLKNRYVMKVRFLKRLQRIGQCCKNTTRGKMRILYRRKILIGKLYKIKNMPTISKKVKSKIIFWR